jgi:NADP-dependent 3-hydroxy acid dehydrogenase YdfG
MKSEFPAPVTEYHMTTYPAIDPRRPELSVKGKTVVITGAGAGIGQETAKEFGLAGSKELHLIGRTKATLEETKSAIQKEAPKVAVTIHIADVADEDAIERAAKAVGSWDVFVHNAGFLAKRSDVTKADTKEWWKTYEVSNTSV